MAREWGPTYKSTNKLRLIWIAKHAVLAEVIRRATDPDLEPYGIWRWVESEGPDQITVAPAVKELPQASREMTAAVGEDEAPRVVVIFGPNLHRYAFIYQALRRVAERCEAAEAEEGEGCICTTLAKRFRSSHFQAGLPLLPRLVRSRRSRSNTFRRNAELDSAGGVAPARAKRIGIEFLEFQTECFIQYLTEHITYWNLVAGAGKTKMLVALAKMIRSIARAG